MSYVEGDYRPDGDNQPGREGHPIVALMEQGTPEVIELVSVLYDTYTLQQSLRAAADQPPQEMSTSPVHVDPSFTERYRRASLFVEATVHIMRGSFIAYPEDPEYLGSVFNAAFAPYGYQVAEGKVPDTVEYRLQLNEQKNRYDNLGNVFISGDKLEFYRVGELWEDERWEPVGQWQAEPEVEHFTQELNKVRTVLRRISYKDRAEGVSGLHLDYEEQYRLARRLLMETENAMTEGFGSKEYCRWLISLVNHFNIALDDLDMHIDVNPGWQPGQYRTSETGVKYNIKIYIVIK